MCGARAPLLLLLPHTTTAGKALCLSRATLCHWRLFCRQVSPSAWMRGFRGHSTTLRTPGESPFLRFLPGVRRVKESWVSSLCGVVVKL
jgi:hypothetical protein